MQKPSRVQPPATASYKVEGLPRGARPARPPDDGLVEAEIAAFDGFRQGRTLAAMHTKAGETGAPGPDNGDFVGVKT